MALGQSEVAWLELRKPTTRVKGNELCTKLGLTLETLQIFSFNGRLYTTQGVSHIPGYPLSRAGFDGNCRSTSAHRADVRKERVEMHSTCFVRRSRDVVHPPLPPVCLVYGVLSLGLRCCPAIASARPCGLRSQQALSASPDVRHGSGKGALLDRKMRHPGDRPVLLSQAGRGVALPVRTILDGGGGPRFRLTRLRRSKPGVPRPAILSRRRKENGVGSLAKWPTLAEGSEQGFSLWVEIEWGF